MSIQKQASANTIETLEAVLEKLEEVKRKYPGLHFQELYNHRALWPRPSTACRRRTEGRTASYFQAEGRRVPIVVQLSQGRDVTTLLDLTISSNVAAGATAANATPGTLENAAQSVQLGQVARPTAATGFATINGQTRQRYTSVVSAGMGRPLSELQAEAGAALQEAELPPGYSWAWSADLQSQNEEFQRLWLAALLAIVLIYMLLAIQFENLVVPFTILLSVPLCIIGVTLSMFLSGTQFTVMAGVGCLMLVGIGQKRHPADRQHPEKAGRGNEPARGLAAIELASASSRTCCREGPARASRRPDQVGGSTVYTHRSASNQAGLVTRPGVSNVQTNTSDTLETSLGLNQLLFDFGNASNRALEADRLRQAAEFNIETSMNDVALVIKDGSTRCCKRGDWSPSARATWPTARSSCAWPGPSTRRATCRRETWCGPKPRFPTGSST